MSSILNGAKYDFLERTRKFSFIAITALAVLGGFAAVPNPNISFTSFIVEPEHFRQLSDPTWIPMAAAFCTSIFLPFIGVMYCKNSLIYDKKTGILSLIQTSSCSRISYCMGKFLSDLGILLCILAAVTASSFVMVIIKFPHDRLSFYSFLTPFLAVLPGLVFCASISVLIESVALRFGQIGNVMGTILFYIFYNVTLVLSLCGNKNRLAKIFDFLGFSSLKESVDFVVLPKIGHTADLSILSSQKPFQNSPDLPRLVFAGLVPSNDFLMDKILLCCISLLLVIIASLIVPEYEKCTAIQKKYAGEKQIYNDINTEHVSTGISVEYKMMLRGQSKIWWVCLAVLWLSAISAPLAAAQNILWPLLFGWSFMVFSKMGCREYIFNIEDNLRSMNGAFTRQCILNFGVGILFAIGITFPILIRMMIAREFSGICAGIVFCMFMPALALFLGEFTKSSRPFEIVSLTICYLMLNCPPLILGINPQYASIHRIVLIFVLSSAMFLGALCKRKWFYIKILRNN